MSHFSFGTFRNDPTLEEMFNTNNSSAPKYLSKSQGFPINKKPTGQQRNKSETFPEYPNRRKGRHEGDGNEEDEEEDGEEEDKEEYAEENDGARRTYPQKLGSRALKKTASSFNVSSRKPLSVYAQAPRTSTSQSLRVLNNEHRDHALSDKRKQMERTKNVSFYVESPYVSGRSFPSHEEDDDDDEEEDDDYHHHHQEARMPRLGGKNQDQPQSSSSHKRLERAGKNVRRVGYMLKDAGSDAVHITKGVSKKVADVSKSSIKGLKHFFKGLRDKSVKHSALEEGTNPEAEPNIGDRATSKKDTNRQIVEKKAQNAQENDHLDDQEKEDPEESSSSGEEDEQQQQQQEEPYHSDEDDHSSHQKRSHHAFQSDEDEKETEEGKVDQNQLVRTRKDGARLVTLGLQVDRPLKRYEKRYLEEQVRIERGKRAVGSYALLKHPKSFTENDICVAFGRAFLRNESPSFIDALMHDFDVSSRTRVYEVVGEKVRDAILHDSPIKLDAIIKMYVPRRRAFGHTIQEARRAQNWIAGIINAMCRDVCETFTIVHGMGLPIRGHEDTRNAAVVYPHAQFELKGGEAIQASHIGTRTSSSSSSAHQLAHDWFPTPMIEAFLKKNKPLFESLSTVDKEAHAGILSDRAILTHDASSVIDSASITLQFKTIVNGKSIALIFNPKAFESFLVEEGIDKHTLSDAEVDALLFFKESFGLDFETAPQIGPHVFMTKNQKIATLEPFAVSDITQQAFSFSQSAAPSNQGHQMALGGFVATLLQDFDGLDVSNQPLAGKPRSGNVVHLKRGDHLLYCWLCVSSPFRHLVLPESVEHAVQPRTTTITVKSLEPMRLLQNTPVLQNTVGHVMFHVAVESSDLPDFTARHGTAYVTLDYQPSKSLPKSQLDVSVSFQMLFESHHPLAPLSSSSSSSSSSSNGGGGVWDDSPPSKPRVEYHD